MAIDYDIKEYIQIVNGALTDALCEAILKEYSNTNEWIDAIVKKGIDRTIRNTDIIHMTFPNSLAVSEERQKIDKYLFASANNAIQAYVNRFKYCHINKDTGYDLLRYTTGGFYTEHTDAYLEQPRAVSCSFSLNDDYEGGEWAFFGGEFVVKPPKGSAIMFPSNFMYPHQILPVTKGTRYAVITWFI